MTEIIDQNPATIIYHTSSGFNPPFFIELGLTDPAPSTTARGLPILSGDGKRKDGIVLQEGDRARFASSQNYQPLGTDVAAQKNLWIVPSATLAPLALTPRAQLIYQSIKELLKCVATSPEDQFLNSNLSFADTHSTGIGDLSTAV